jgi:UrcA family protein
MFKPTRSGRLTSPMSPLTLVDRDPKTAANTKVPACSGRLIVVCTGMLLGLSQMVPETALADQSTVSASETRATRVSLGDLNLSTPEGMLAARDRLQEAARRLCVHLAESRDVGRQWHLRACMNETLAAALQQLSAHALASVPKVTAPPPDVVSK